MQTDIIYTALDYVTEVKLLCNRIKRGERWGELLKVHQDASGQVKQSRWAKCWEMWQELSQVIHQNHQE
jgi:hypothetical protein